MPKLPHEAIVQLVRHAPDVVLRLLDPGRDFGARALRVGPAEFVDLNFAEYRADVVLLCGPVERPEKAYVVEAQGEPNARKRRAWTLYASGMHVRLGCPVVLVVIALDPAVARWCREPIDVGDGRFVLHPWVLGPEVIPVITDPEVARAAPELAVLSVAAHADEPGAEAIAFAALSAVYPLDDERGVIYPDFIIALLPLAARVALEKLMQSSRYEFQTDFLRRAWQEGIAAGKAAGMTEGKAEGKAEGRVEGKAEALLKLLRLKGFSFSDAERQRVLACTDEQRLDSWMDRVLAARDLGEVFAD